MWFASNKEVRRIVELTLLNIIYILFFSLVITTIIAVALIIAVEIIISKSELTNKKTHLSTYQVLMCFYNIITWQTTFVASLFPMFIILHLY